ncbi:MAG: T9SS type A sorting domain-containing protein [Bacteroidia bacterium]
MKKNILFISALFVLTAGTNAQIPNAGFENWTTVGSYMDPQGYLTPNYLATTSFYAVTQSVDHYPANIGSYSIKLANNISLLPNDGFGVVLQNRTNVMFNGPGPAFPVTGHPNSLTGYYKWVPQGGDTMLIEIQLFKNGSNVSSAKLSTTVPAASWTSFNIPFSSYTSADSASILISSYYANSAQSKPHGNSVLNVDNINFDTFIGISTYPDLAKNFKLYPNASNGNFEVSFETTENENVTIGIYDLTGKEVARLFNGQMNAGPHAFIYKLPELNSGNYFYVIDSVKGKKVEKIVVQK